MKAVGIIPARYESSRLHGKPLADINGKPMVWWVYKEALKVKEFDEVIIATESTKIISACEELGMKAMLTSDQHPTGTDRVAEVAQYVPADLYVVIMGDEPLVTANDERILISAAYDEPDASAIMLTKKFQDPVDVENRNTIKLAVNNDGYLIFMSRSAIPYPKENIDYSFYKNIGCYALRKETLDYFLDTTPGNIEQAEGIELMRLLENHKKVFTVPIESESISVDTQIDLEKVRKILST